MKPPAPVTTTRLPLQSPLAVQLEALFVADHFRFTCWLGGDWKLVGGLGAFFGPQRLMTVLILTLLINGVMALGMVIWKRRVGQTLRNLGRMIGAFSSLRLPGPEMTIENPEAVKVPFGVAAAVAVLLYTSSQPWGAF